MERAGHGQRPGGAAAGGKSLGLGNHRGTERAVNLGADDDDEDEDDESFHTSDAGFINDGTLEEYDDGLPMLYDSDDDF